MAQKVNPISLRLQQTNREFDNCWYSKYFYKKLVNRDLYLHQYINNFCNLLKLPKARFSLQYSAKTSLFYSFLCYPKQSREIRSRIFGIFFKKKRKNKYKNKLVNYLKENKSKNQESFFLRNFKKKKSLKFLVNNHFWSRLSLPFFNKKEKGKNEVFGQKTTQSDTLSPKNRVSTFLFCTSLKSLHKKASVLTNSSTNLGYFILPLLVQNRNTFPFYFANSKNFCLQSLKEISKFHDLKKKQIRQQQKGSSTLSQKKKKENNDFFFFLKEFLSNLFFLKNFKENLFTYHEKKRKSRKHSTEFQEQKNKQYENFSSFHREYRKNLLKFFLVFSFLSNNGFFLKKATPPLLEKNSRLNSFVCFSNFQSNSIFSKTVQKKTPLDLVVQYDTTFSSKNTLFFKKKTTFHSFFSSSNLREQQKELSVFNKRKKGPLQELKYKKYFHYFLSSHFNINTEILPFKVSHDWQSAGFLADEIVYFLERRVPFRRLKKKILQKIAENPAIRGVRISCSGRVGGKSKKAQRAKTQCVKYGQTSRHTFSSRIDFAARTARTIFGSVGIKVWICFN